MKAKKFENIKKLAKEVGISSSKLNEVVGGQFLPRIYLFSCVCAWGANPPYRPSWVRYYSAPQEIYSDLMRICRNGRGSCRRIG